MHITLEWLKDQGACTPSLNRFALEYPDGVDLTPDNIRDAAPHYDLYWLAFKILSPLKFVAFQRTIGAAINQCSNMIDAARRARERAIGPAPDARTVGIAWATYEQVKQAATEDYRRAVADALITSLGLCIPQESRP